MLDKIATIGSDRRYGSRGGRDDPERGLDEVEPSTARDEDHNDAAVRPPPESGSTGPVILAVAPIISGIAPAVGDLMPEQPMDRRWWPQGDFTDVAPTVRLHLELVAA